MRGREFAAIANLERVAAAQPPNLKETFSVPTTVADDQSKELPVSMQLNDIGGMQSIPRKEGESDADYAERMVYELDVGVEELWACQDRIRHLVKVEE
jgi:hypothetical protein